MKSFKTLSIIRISAILLLAEHIGACFWFHKPFQFNTYPAYHSNYVWNTVPQFTPIQYPSSNAVINIPVYTIPSNNNRVVPQVNRQIYVPKQAPQQRQTPSTPNQIKPPVYTTVNVAKQVPSTLNQIKPPVYTTVNVAKQESKLNSKHVTASTQTAVISGIKNETFTKHNQVMPHVNETFNVTKSDSKSETKHEETLKAITNAMNDFRSYIEKISNVSQHERKSECEHIAEINAKAVTSIMNALKNITSKSDSKFGAEYEEILKSINNTMKDLKFHIEKISNVSQHEAKSKCEHIAEINAKAVISIMNALKNITSKSDYKFETKYEETLKSITNAMKDLKFHIEKLSNVSQHEANSKSALNIAMTATHESKHNISSKEEALKALINVIKEFTSHVGKEAQSKSFQNTTTTTTTKEEFLKSLIKAIYDFTFYVNENCHVSAKESELKSFHNVTTKEEAVKLLITAIKNIKPNVEQAPQEPASESKRKAISKEEASKLIFNALKDLKARSAKTNNISKQETKLNNTQRAATKEALDSIIIALNKVIANVPQENCKYSRKNDVEAKETALKSIITLLKDVITQECKVKSERNTALKGQSSKSINIASKDMHSVSTQQTVSTTKWMNNVPAQR